MDRYKVTKLLGDGTYGTVMKGIVHSTGEIVAIKKMKQKFFSWEECLDLREITVLRKVTHPNIVKLKEVVRAQDELHLVFEYCDTNLIQGVTEPEESQIKTIVQQCLVGLDHLHKQGFMHRDIKPENILVKDSTYKVADFGLAREIRTQPPYTDYVSTRWYRAPEILLRAKRYSYQVDIFALGCIFAELYLRRPLFSGSNEIDQLNRICSILGTPEDWPEGHRLASAINYCFPQYVCTPISEILKGASPLACDLIRMMLTWDPDKRPTAEQCLNHNFFAVSNLQLSLNLPSSIRNSYGALPSDTNRSRYRAGEGLRSFGASIIAKPTNSIGQGRYKF